MQLIGTLFTYLSAAHLRAANMNRVTTQETVTMYQWDTPEAIAGRDFEALMLQLTLLLDIKDAYLAEAGSELDCRLKVDLVVEYHDGSAAGIQIKSSEAGAKNFMKKFTKVTSKGKAYPAPGVIYLEGGESPYKMLLFLSHLLNVPINKEMEEALSFVKRVRASQPQKRLRLKRQHLKLTDRQLNGLILIKLCAFQGGEYIF